MRVVFMSSAYFGYGYVHTHTFDPAAYGDAATPELPARPTHVVDTEEQQTSTAGDPLLTRLAAWVNDLTREVIC
jgi:hypothetical protein